MLITTVPSMAIAIIVFLTASLIHHSPEVSQTEEFSATLRDTFFNIISPLMSVAVAAIGYRIYRSGKTVAASASGTSLQSDSTDSGAN